MGEPVRLLTETEAAELLKVGARTLRELRRQGHIRYVALTARKIMYRPEDCAEYVDSRVRLNDAPAQPGKPKRSPRGRSGVVIPFSQIHAR